MNFKKIILVAIIITLTCILSVSYVQAQISPSGISNATPSKAEQMLTFDSGNQTNSISSSSNPSDICKNTIFEKMHSKSLLLDNTKAIVLASNSNEFKSRNMALTSKYVTTFNTWNLDTKNCDATWKNVNVGYVTNDTTGHIVNIVLTLDPALTKILNVTEYPSVFLNDLGSVNWSGYQFVGSGSPTINEVDMGTSFVNIYQPSSPSNSCRTDLGKISCDIASWTGLVSDRSGSSGIIQTGIDETVRCMPTCTKTYNLFYEVFPNPAFICGNSLMQPTDQISSQVIFTGSIGNTGYYNISTQDTTINYGCSASSQASSITNPKGALFIGETANNGTMFETLAKFDPITESGYFFDNNGQHTISSTYVNNTYNMQNFPYNNISFSTISGGAFSQTWQDSRVGTLLCFPPPLSNPVQDWRITSSCTLGYPIRTSYGNINVNANSVLTIPSSSKLNINLSQKSIMIYPGSGILIQADGAID